MSDSNLFLASKELDVDNINFEENQYQANEDESFFPQNKIIFIFSDNSSIEDDIEILFLKYCQNNITLKINLLSENIYNHIEKFPTQTNVLNGIFFIKNISLKDNGVCKLKLEKKGKNV